MTTEAEYEEKLVLAHRAGIASARADKEATEWTAADRYPDAEQAVYMAGYFGEMRRMAKAYAIDAEPEHILAPNGSFLPKSYD